jgi:metal-responsive CopG/Arc/MetJ family transcriptional regulator
MKRLTVKIPDELHTQFKVIATLEQKDMTEIVLRMVREYVEKAQKKLKK